MGPDAWKSDSGPLTENTIIMSPPKYFEVSYSINPWMRPGGKKADRYLAYIQWYGLYKKFKSLGKDIRLIPPRVGLPDMVFIDAGILYSNLFIPSNFTFEERQGEQEYFVEWFKRRRCDVVTIDRKYKFEGNGDTLWAGERLFFGYGFRSQREAHEQIKPVLPHVRLISLELIDPLFYHLDTCLCLLNDAQAIFLPGAFSQAAQSALDREVELFAVAKTEGKRFACNSVVLGKHVVIPNDTPKTCELLKKLGFETHPLNVSEFIKSGGAIKCLSMHIQLPTTQNKTVDRPLQLDSSSLGHRPL